MHGTRHLVAEFGAAFGAGVRGDLTAAIMPPATLISAFASEVSGLETGAQDLHTEAGGAYTGELSGAMLLEAGARWVLVGHSERREYAGETDDVVAAKFRAAVRCGLTPILCVGETEAERDAGEHEQVVGRQVGAVLAGLAAGELDDLVVAYEPVWAIGTGRTATPDVAQEMHAAIRGQLARTDAAGAERARILYGGSVNPDNAVELFAQDDIDGGLVGGASLKTDSFASIIASAPDAESG